MIKFILPHILMRLLGLGTLHQQCKVISLAHDEYHKGIEKVSV